MASLLLSSSPLSSSFLNIPRKLLVHGHCPSQTTLWFSRKQSSLCVRAATLPQGVISLLNVLLSLYPIRDWNFRFYLSTFFLCWEDDSAKEGTQIQTSVSGIYIHSWDMELQSLYDWSHRILHCWAGEFQWLSNICRQDWLKTELSFFFFFLPDSEQRNTSVDWCWCWKRAWSSSLIRIFFFVFQSGHNNFTKPFWLFFLMI